MIPCVYVTLSNGLDVKKPILILSFTVYTVPECVPKERNKKHGFRPFKALFGMGENTHIYYSADFCFRINPADLVVW